MYIVGSLISLFLMVFFKKQIVSKFNLSEEESFNIITVLTIVFWPLMAPAITIIFLAITLRDKFNNQEVE